jgi:hypothetical protein
MSLFDNASIITTPNAYKAGTLYSIKPDTGLGDFDVVRNTTATRVNSAGLIETVGNNVPRIDYPPLGGCPSILVEPQATNLLLRSEEFDNNYWTKGNLSTITPNATTAPDGTLNADKHVTSNGTFAFAIVTTPTSILDVTHTISVFAKAAEITLIQLRAGGFAGNCFCNFDLVQGISGIPSNCVSNITNFGNGWFRCSISYLRNSDRQSVGFNIITSINQGIAPLISGNGVDGIFIWGAQLEVGSVATSYIPTVASAVTRNADVINKSGISSLLGQIEGSVYIKFDAGNNFTINMLGFSKVVNGETEYLLTYTPTEVRHYVDGILEQTDAGVYDWSNMDFIELGSINNSNFLNGRILNFWTSKYALQP